MSKAAEIGRHLRRVESRYGRRATRAALATTLGLTLVLGILLGMHLVVGDIEGLCEGASAPCLAVADLRGGDPYSSSLLLYDMRDSSMAAVGGKRRRFVPLQGIPAEVRRAWIAVEDRRFHIHGGVDPLGIGRAAVGNVAGGEVRSGASTIAMQLVRILWEDQAWELGRWRRKLLELRTAPRLVDELGRDRVLELYLNGVYLGDGVYGVAAAARHYFGIDVSELNASQTALLVGITRTPGRYDPRKNPDLALQRRNVVLALMHEQKVIEEHAYSEALERPLEVLETSPIDYRRGHATAAVRRELRRVAPELVGMSGLSVFTTIDPDMQRLAEDRMTEHLSRITEGEFGSPSNPDRQVQGGLVALDSEVGAIRAVVGGHDFRETELNRATQTRRQIGSLVKPLLMASWLQRGGRASTPFSTAEIALETPDGLWRPADHVDEGQLVPREVIAQSSNRAAVRMGQEVSPAALASDLGRFGISGEIPPFPSIFLGSFEASLLEMTAAYATFENGGRGVDPYLIRRIEDGRGRVLYRAPNESHAGTPVLDRETAFLVREALQRAVSSGTGWRAGAGITPGAVAGKTGTSNQGRDAWFVGITPGLSVGVWIGHDRPASIVPGGSGGTLAAPVWNEVVGALELVPVSPRWDAPSGVRLATVDLATGREVSAGCRSVAGPTPEPLWVRTNPAVRLSGSGSLRGRSAEGRAALEGRYSADGPAATCDQRRDPRDYWGTSRPIRVGPVRALGVSGDTISGSR